MWRLGLPSRGAGGGNGQSGWRSCAHRQPVGGALARARDREMPETWDLGPGGPDPSWGGRLGGGGASPPGWFISKHIKAPLRAVLSLWGHLALHTRCPSGAPRGASALEDRGGRDLETSSSRPPTSQPGPTMPALWVLRIGQSWGRCVLPAPRRPARLLFQSPESQAHRQAPIFAIDYPSPPSPEIRWALHTLPDTPPSDTTLTVPRSFPGVSLAP